MKSALRRYLLLPALVIYSGLLLFAATPDEIRPDAVADLQTQVRRGFKGANLRPYAFVFAGRRGRWKRRSVILTVHARMRGGGLERVFAAPESPLDGFRATRPAEETWALKSLVISPGNKLMTSVRRSQRRAQIRGLQRHPRIQKISRFACASTYAAAGRADRVYVSVAYDTIDYKTGRIAKAAHVIQIFDCRYSRPVTGGAWPGARVGADGMPRPTPGRPDRIFRGWGSRDRATARARDARKTRKTRKTRKARKDNRLKALEPARESDATRRVRERMPKATPRPMLRDMRPPSPRFLGPTRDAVRHLDAGDT